MKYQHLIRKVAKRTKVPEAKVDRVTKSLFKEIMRNIAEGDQVRIVNFGVFAPYTVRNFKFRDVVTNEMKSVPSRRILKFRSSRLLKTKMNENLDEE